jgi:hypothetical protein
MGTHIPLILAPEDPPRRQRDTVMSTPAAHWCAELDAR